MVEENEPLSSPYFPDIPDSIAQGATEDTSKNYDASADSQSPILQGNHFSFHTDNRPFVNVTYQP